MVQYSEPTKTPVGLFSSKAVAEQAFAALQGSGIPVENLALMPQSLNPYTPIADTEAGKSGKAGAIVGTLLGAIVGLVFGYLALQLGQISDWRSTDVLVGAALLGSGIGAAAVGILGALSGVNVTKAQVEPEYAEQAQHYLILAHGTPEELAQVQAMLQQQGSDPLPEGFAIANP